jgi:hydrogenase-4 component F
MTPLGQGATGLAVALGFALLGTRRTTGMAMLCAAQAVVVAVAALAQGEVAVALVACIEAGVVALLGGMGERVTPTGREVDSPLLPPTQRHPRASGDPGGMGPRLRGDDATGDRPIIRASGIILPLALRAGSASQPKRSMGGGVPFPRSLAAGAVLAALATIVPGTGLPLAVILLGLLVVASRTERFHQALGIAAAQNGLMLAVIAANLSGWRLVPVVIPWLPAFALGALWFGSDRARTAALLAARLASRIDAALCALVLLLACALPWRLGAQGSFWRLDPRSVHVVLLLAALAAAASWARRNAITVWGSRLAILAGTVLAVLSTAPLLSWLGMALATVGAAADTLPARTEAWRRLRLGSTGLGLALFGTIALHAGATALPSATVALPAIAAPATACVMLGYGALAVLAPELTIAAIALILRLRSPPAEGLLLALGLVALLVAALGLATARSAHRQTLPLLLPLVGLAQGGAAVFAFGLGTDAGNFAGLLQLSLLALTQCALLLAPEPGLDRVAALAGLAGLPPFGLFPSLALILIATAQSLAWLLLPFGAGLAAIAWAVLLQLPSERRLRASPAWVPLALLLLAGFAMPETLLDWFRLAAR